MQTLQRHLVNFHVRNAGMSRHFLIKVWWTAKQFKDCWAKTADKFAQTISSRVMALQWRYTELFNTNMYSMLEYQIDKDWHDHK